MANNNSQVANIDLSRSLTFGALDEQDVATIKEMIAKDLTVPEFKLFMLQAKAMDADPLKQETWPVAYGSAEKRKLTIHYAVALYERKAKEFPNYGGVYVTMVHDGDDFEVKYESNEMGIPVPKVKHTVKGNPNKIIAGYGYAIDKTLDIPYFTLLSAEDVAHYMSPDNNSGGQRTMWKNNFRDMFTKHIKKRLLKSAFGLSVPGDNDEGQTYQVKDMGNIEADQEPNTVADDMEIPTMPEVEIIDPPADKKKTESEAKATPNEYERLRAEVSEKSNTLGIKGDELTSYMVENIPGFKASYKPTTNQLKTLIVSLDADIEDKK